MVIVFEVTAVAAVPEGEVSGVESRPIRILAPFTGVRMLAIVTPNA